MNAGTFRSRQAMTCAVAAALLASCGRGAPLEDLPGPAEALAAAGRRLSRSLSAGDLTRIAARGDRVLASLNAQERDALGRAHLRFTLPEAATVAVAFSRGSQPFWLADQGFRPAFRSFDVGGRPWEVFEKVFGAGRVGLGVNGLGPAPPDHYVVFLHKGGVGSPLPAGLDPAVWDVTRVGAETVVAGEPLAAEDLPAALRAATLIRPVSAPKLATPLVRGRAWKTHVVAGAAPGQITVTFGADPCRELTLAWTTAPGAGRSIVRVRPAGRPDQAAVVEGRSEFVRTPSVLNDPEVRRHTVRLRGLTPATAYEYAVGDGTAGGTSAWATVRTAPERSGDARLIYMGDPQCGLEGWGKLLAGADKRSPGATALLIAGDLVDRGNERTNWDHFFLRAAGVFEHLPLLPAAGNHEYLDRGPVLYRAFFDLPANGPAASPPGLVYAVELGDAFLAVLDSTPAAFDPAQAEAQASWLDGRLRATRCSWKLVMFHHPLHASHPSREYPKLRDAWAPVLERNRVDLVLQGHDHAYLRTYPMRAGKRVATAAEGTVYVVAVSGDKYCEQNPRDYAEVAFTHASTYQTIDVRGREGTLTYRSFDASGRERDRLELARKAAPGPVARR